MTTMISGRGTLVVRRRAVPHRPTIGLVTADDTPDPESADARAAVLTAVAGWTDRGGLPLRPADLHTRVPISSLPAALSAKVAAHDRLSPAERETWSGSRRWVSGRPWLGPLAQARERALVFVAVDIVGRIVAGVAWPSEYLDDHRIRLDLRTELHEIDEQAHRLAALRHEAGTAVEDRHGPVLTHGWDSLVDRVAALLVYANRLAALDSRLTHRAADGRAALTDEPAAGLVAGSARDELATDHLRALADDLRHLADDVTNSSTSHRNAT
jgi:hypothetical protein